MLLGNAFRSGIYIVIINLLMTYVALPIFNKKGLGSKSSAKIEACNKKYIVLNGGVDFVVVFLAVIFGKLLHIGKPSNAAFALKCAAFAIVLHLLISWTMSTGLGLQKRVKTNPNAPDILNNLILLEECKHDNLGLSVLFIGVMAFLAVLLS